MLDLWPLAALAWVVGFITGVWMERVTLARIRNQCGLIRSGVRILASFFAAGIVAAIQGLALYFIVRLPISEHDLPGLLLFLLGGTGVVAVACCGVTTVLLRYFAHRSSKRRVVVEIQDP